MSAASHVIQRSAVASQWAKSETINLFRFIQQPTYREHCVEEPDWAVRAVYLSLLLGILLMPLAYFIHSLQDHLGIAEWRPATADVATFLSVVLLVPLLEESLYRAGLKNPVCSLAVAPVVTMAFIVNSVQHAILIAIFPVIIVILTVAHRSLFFGVSSAQLEELHSQKFRLIFWANCLYFACAHLGNFQLSGVQTALFSLVIAPQLVFAALFSYLRLRNGIKSAILSHATINLVAFAAYTTQSTS